MARPKKKPSPPWLTGKAYKWDGNKAMPPWMKLDMTLLQDKAFGSLSASTRLVYLSMMLHAGDKATDWFTFTVTAAERYNISRSTLQKSVKDLCEAGFIEAKRPGIGDGWSVAEYAPTLYRATPTEWKNRPDPKPKKVTRKKSGKTL